MTSMWVFIVSELWQLFPHTSRSLQSTSRYFKPRLPTSEALLATTELSPPDPLSRHGEAHTTPL